MQPLSGTTRLGALLGFGVLAVLVASTATTAVAAAGHAAGVPLVMNGNEIPIAGFGTLTAMFALAGLALAAALGRFSRHPRRDFVRATLVLTALSFLPDLLSTADPSTKMLFMSAHVVAAAIVIPVVAWRLPRRRDRVAVEAGTAAGLRVGTD